MRAVEVAKGLTTRDEFPQGDFVSDPGDATLTNLNCALTSPQMASEQLGEEDG